MPARLDTNLSHVAVIGGAGFLGRHIVQALLTFSNRTKTARISVLDLNLDPEQTPADYPIYDRGGRDSNASSRTSTTGDESKPSIPITFHACDISSLSSLTALLDELRPDVVYHTASPHADAPHTLLEKVNVQGTANVIEACRTARLRGHNGGGSAGSTSGKLPGVRALVYTSSASVVFDARRKNPAGLVNADERWPVVMGKAQSEFYTDTKARAERLILAANNTPLTPPPQNDKPNNEKENTLLTCALRPAGIFGEHDGQLLPNLLLALRRGQTRFQVGNNTNLFDFTYAGNVAWAHLLAAAGLLGNANARNAANKVAKVDPNKKEKPEQEEEDEEEEEEEDKIIAGEAFFITNASPVPFYDFCRAVWNHASHANQASTPPPSSSSSSSPIIIPTSLALLLATLAELLFRIFSLITTGDSTKFKPNLTRQRIWFSTVTRYYSVEKARRRLGYEPVVGLQEGVRRGVEWVCWNKRKGNGEGIL